MSALCSVGAVQQLAALCGATAPTILKAGNVISKTCTALYKKVTLRFDNFSCSFLKKKKKPTRAPCLPLTPKKNQLIWRRSSDCCFYSFFFFFFFFFWTAVFVTGAKSTQTPAQFLITHTHEASWRRGSGEAKARDMRGTASKQARSGTRFLAEELTLDKELPPPLFKDMTNDKDM